MYREFDPTKYESELLGVLNGLSNIDEPKYNDLRKLLKEFIKKDGNFFSKDELVAGYHHLVSNGQLKEDTKLLEKIRMKPTRTMSGVTTVTVLTKPYPCPGNCIFCPDDVRMPKSYLSNEPGAQRAEKNKFDPYLQVYNRLVAIHNIGHNTDKIELIILGGTWSYYPDDYKIWFITQCFAAMNDFSPGVNEIDPDTHKEEKEQKSWEWLELEQQKNETAKSRCVGLVIETRPDYISEEEIIKTRRLGATKVQIGIQSLDDEILNLNGRGHSVEETVRAIKLLRQAGFKIHAHWMANLYGSSVEKDLVDYKRLWEPGIQPDELKLYPTSILKGTILNKLYEQGKYKPFTHEELMKVITESMMVTPRYCRITRIIRDIPSSDIIEGNKFTNFRQLAEKNLIENGHPCQCVRCREVRGAEVQEEDLELEEIRYKTNIGEELFISFKTKSDDKIAGFLRLSLQDEEIRSNNFIEELRDAAIIREVHVYGQVVGIGEKEEGRSQHLGLGKKLLARAEDLATEYGFQKISVISAIGTREYYRNQGFEDGNLYLQKSLA